LDHKTWMEHFSAAVIVPAAWAVIAAIFVFIASYAVTLAFQLITGEGDPRFWALILGGLTLPCVHVYAMSWWSDQVTPPKPVFFEPADTTITYYQNVSTPYLAGDYDTIKVPRSKLTLVFRELVERNYRTAALGGAGKILTRSEAEILREYLIAKGLARRDNSNQANSPWNLTPEGKDFVFKNARIAPPTEVSDIGNWPEMGE